ncbi:hypothetical protein [Promicromonospora sp. MEB111]|uniref:hypothetical protein n=1 Tax=Promicromonospora sp. MEB111 TaxID=3040301 RepID=UPI00254FCC9C|nr:hypothetical protein [Promicromonospora sp. MEB111]
MSTLIGVVVTMAFNGRAQTLRLRNESEESARERGEVAARDDRRRYIDERRSIYLRFSSTVDEWMIESQAAILLEEEEGPGSDLSEVRQRCEELGSHVREHLNEMTLICPLQVLEAAGEVNFAINADSAKAPLEVQPLLLKFLFECRRDLIGAASWPIVEGPRPNSN